MTRVCGVRVYQRAAVTTVRSRPLGVVENASATRTRARALCWYHRPCQQDTARVSLQFHHTVIAAAAAAAHDEKNAKSVPKLTKAKIEARAGTGAGADAACFRY